MYKTSSRLINSISLVIGLLIAVAPARIARAQTAQPASSHTRPASQTTRHDAPTRSMTPSVKTDKRVYLEPPPPALPRAGETFVDPIFGTTIMRVTDERDGNFNATCYSYYPTFNKNSTRLIVFTGSTSYLYDFDPVNFRISNKRRLFQATMPGGGYPGSEDAIWSALDPDVMYCHAYLKIYAYNVATNTYALVHDFAGEVAASELVQMSKSADDGAFGFHFKDAGNKVVGYLAWRRAQNALYKVMTSDVNEVQVDKTGQYLYVITETSGTASAIEGKVVNLQTRQVADLTDGPPDYAPGHKDMGHGFVIGAENWKNSFLYRQLATPHKHYTVISFGNDWSQSNHASLLADDESWVLISTYTSNDLPSTKVFRNELFLASTDGKERVRRLAHTHSVYREYWDTPRANISRDGKFAAFTSNWGSTTRRDMFIVKIPPPGADENAVRNELTRPPVADITTSTLATASRQNVVWASLIHCAATGNSVQKISGRDDSPDALAKSQQAIASGDGFIEFTAVETNKTRLCGLALEQQGADAAEIAFAIKLTADGIAEVRESNAYAGETPYRSGDVFRIAVEGEQVKYYKNGALFFTSLNAPSYPLVAKASFIHLQSRIINAVISTSRFKNGQ